MSSTDNLSLRRQNFRLKREVEYHKRLTKQLVQRASPEVEALVTAQMFTQEMDVMGAEEDALREYRRAEKATARANKYAAKAEAEVKLKNAVANKLAAEEAMQYWRAQLEEEKSKAPLPYFDFECLNAATTFVASAHHTIRVAALTLDNPLFVKALVDRPAHVELLVALESSNRAPNRMPDVVERLRQAGGQVRLLKSGFNRAGYYKWEQLFNEVTQEYNYAGTDGQQHNKIIIVDDTAVMTGSFNFTVHASCANRENCVKIMQETSVKKYVSYFNRVFHENPLGCQLKVQASGEVRLEVFFNQGRPIDGVNDASRAPKKYKTAIVKG